MFSPAVLIFLILINFHPSYAQRLLAPNSIYLELLGNGLLYSVNYDRMFNENFGARIGVTYFPALTSFFNTVEDIFLMPVTLNTFIGGENNKLEMGVGIVYLQLTASTIFSEEKQNVSGAAETLTIGYRYQPRLGGFVFRVGFTPIFRFGKKFVPFGGISIGTSF
jgi:hypothetical protein